MTGGPSLRPGSGSTTTWLPSSRLGAGRASSLLVTSKRKLGDLRRSESRKMAGFAQGWQTAVWAVTRAAMIRKKAEERKSKMG